MLYNQEERQIYYDASRMIQEKSSLLATLNLRQNVLC